MRHDPTSEVAWLRHQQLVQWLSNLPENMLLGWADRHAESNTDRVCGWADILVVPAPEIECGWGWTIAQPHDRMNDSAVTIYSKCDLPSVGEKPSGWSYQRISELLNEWTVKNTERSDIRFEHDPELHLTIRRYIETELQDPLLDG